MIAFVSGTVEAIEENAAVIDSGTLGFRVFMSPHGLSKLTVGAPAKIYTYLKVAEDAMDLYGFSTQEELNMFELLISVSGVGAKGAIAILSSLTPQKLAVSLVTNDVSSIKKATGIGPKTAQRIVLELKDKLKKEQEIVSSCRNKKLNSIK